MKKILIAFTLAGVFTACGTGGGNSAGSDSTKEVNSTTPPATSNSTNPVADSLN